MYHFSKLVVSSLSAGKRVCRSKMVIFCCFQYKLPRENQNKRYSMISGLHDDIDLMWIEIIYCFFLFFFKNFILSFLTCLNIETLMKIFAPRDSCVRLFSITNYNFVIPITFCYCGIRYRLYKIGQSSIEDKTTGKDIAIYKKEMKYMESHIFQPRDTQSLTRCENQNVRKYSDL